MWKWFRNGQGAASAELQLLRGEVADLRKRVTAAELAVAEAEGAIFRHLKAAASREKRAAGVAGSTTANATPAAGPTPPPGLGPVGLKRWLRDQRLRRARPAADLLDDANVDGGTDGLSA